MGTRILGIDVGRRRIGLAISDASAVLARPLTTIEVRGADPLPPVLDAVKRLSAEDGGLASIAVGLPRRLDGTASDDTPHVQAFIDALRVRTGIPVVAVDERLTSREAESRLALQEPDWRKRKVKLDAAAAAVILQDYLDSAASRSRE